MKKEMRWQFNILFFVCLFMPVSINGGYQSLTTGRIRSWYSSGRPGNQGFPGRPEGRRNLGRPGYPGGPGNPGRPGFPVRPKFPGRPVGPGGPGYSGKPVFPGLPGGPGYQGRPGRPGGQYYPGRPKTTTTPLPPTTTTTLPPTTTTTLPPTTTRPSCGCYPGSRSSLYSSSQFAVLATVTHARFTPVVKPHGYTSAVIYADGPRCRGYEPILQRSIRINTLEGTAHCPDAFAHLQNGQRYLFYGTIQMLGYRRSFVIDKCSPPCQLDNSYSCPASITPDTCRVPDTWYY